MRSNKFVLLMAMLVLAIFAVGSVSAADNVTADIDVPTEDMAIDDVAVDEIDEQEETTSDVDVDVNDESGNLRGPVYVNTSMTLSQIQTTINNAAAGSTVYFNNGTYTGITLTLKSNIVYSGYEATLIGTGTNHIFNLPNNMNNFTICGFTLDVNNNNAADKISAIYGSFITNGNINDNTMYNGTNGININKYYDNMTVDNNIIYDMKNDGISFANPVSNSNIASLGKTNITNNNISSCKYGIFIGGNFKGNISNNTISNCQYGIEFAGKPKPAAGNGTLIATLYNNTISSCDIGINMLHPNVEYLYLDYMVFDDIEDCDIYTESPFGTYTYIGVYHSRFDCGVSSAFYTAVGSNKDNTNTNFTIV